MTTRPEEVEKRREAEAKEAKKQEKDPDWLEKSDDAALSEALAADLKRRMEDS